MLTEIKTNQISVAFDLVLAAKARGDFLVTASVEMKRLNGWSAAAAFEGEFSNATTSSYAAKGRGATFLVSRPLPVLGVNQTPRLHCGNDAKTLSGHISTLR